MPNQKKAEITRVSRGKHKGEFKFQLIGGNGEPVAQSYPESYPAKQSCIKTLKNDFPDFEIVDLTK
jgi:uncharacterized protein YegP (UPF0339 family)